MEIDVKPNKNLTFLWSCLKDRIEGTKRHSWLCLEGSSRSGKTWAIISFLAMLCMKPDLIGERSIIVRAYRNDGTTCRDTIVEDFIEIMTRQFGGENAKGEWISAFTQAGRWNVSTLTYTFSNGSTFSFKGASDAGKLHGKKATISWLNEAMEISYDAQKQIAMRTTFLKIADWNPSETVHWIFDRVMTKNNPYAYCHSTYKDNIDNLTPEQVFEIEQLEPTPQNIANGTADRFKWQVYGLGQRGTRENLIFEPWRWDVIDDDDFPKTNVCKRYGYGLDFGHSVDPSALIDCRFHNGALYFDEKIYKERLLFGRSYDNPDVPSIVGLLEELEIPKYAPISGDEAASEGITQIRVAGWNIRGTKKPAILDGLNVLKQFHIFVTRSSQNIIRELQSYAYIKKSNGEITDVPEDKNNHAIDAMRYWAWDNVRANNMLIGSNRFKPISHSNDDFSDF